LAYFFFPAEKGIIPILHSIIQIQQLQSRHLFTEVEKQLNYFLSGGDYSLRTERTLQGLSAISKGVAG